MTEIGSQSSMAGQNPNKTTQNAKRSTLLNLDRAGNGCVLLMCLLSAIDQKFPWYAVGSIVLILCASSVMYVCIDLLLERLRSDDLMWDLRMAFSTQIFVFLYTVYATLNVISNYLAGTGWYEFQVAVLFLFIIILAGSTLIFVKSFINVLRKLKAEREGLASPACSAEALGKTPTT